MPDVFLQQHDAGGLTDGSESLGGFMAHHDVFILIIEDPHQHINDLGSLHLAEHICRLMTKQRR